MKRTQFFVVGLAVLAGAAGLLAWRWGIADRGSGAGGAAQVSYTRFLEQVRAGEVTKAVMTNEGGTTQVKASLRDGRAMRSSLPADFRQELTLMMERSVDVEIAPRAASSYLFNAIPFLLLVVVWLVMFAKMRNSGAKPWFTA